MSLPSLLLAWLAVAAPSAPPPGAPGEAALRAVVEAVRLRMGADADVIVDAVHEVAVAGGALTDAVPAPGAKLGGLVRFVLRAAGARRGDPSRMMPIGHAIVALRVSVDHVHTSRPVRRGAALGESDLAPARHVFESGALERPPTADGALNGRVLRDLPAGACLTRQAFVPARAVRAGAEVVAIVRTGGVEARAELVSVDSGDPGDSVRVMNKQSRRTFRARVVARDLVEISHE